MQYVYYIMFSEFDIAAVDMKGGNAAVYQGEPKQGKAGVTMTCSEDLFIKMASGEVNGQQVRIESIDFPDAAISKG